MNNRYIIVGAMKGLTEGRGSLAAKFVPAKIIKQHLMIWIDDETEVLKIIDQVNKKGFAFAESTAPDVVPMCFKIMTEKYMNSLI